jgi:hypothetical protein
VNDVSLRSLSGIHRSGSDYVITPDTSAHTFDDFAAGEELMDLGREAAEAALPEIKERVAKSTIPSMECLHGKNFYFRVRLWFVDILVDF